MSEQSLYEMVGGAKPLRKLVDDFYDFMETSQETREVRSQHPADLTESRQKLFDFLSGWTGGPALFEQKYGHPRLRARHLPFKIGVKERDQWLMCMAFALSQSGFPQTAIDILRSSLSRLADHMRNQEEAL